MYVGLSSALKLTGLNDFITPSQECVKPVIIEKTSAQRGKIEVEPDGSYKETDAKGRAFTLQTAQITLADCLACSGCVTTAEAVLIQQQSYSELRKALNDKVSSNNFIVVSISPQARASVAAKFKLTLNSANTALKNYFYSKGVDLVLDSSVSRHLSLLAQCAEFCGRYERFLQGDREVLPLLSSACPGWICYAEKSHGASILSHISAVRSPQAIMGAIVKDFVAKRVAKSPSEIFHVAVMPCFDKKLEASRDDFLVPGTSVREVDCVVSTGELAAVLEEESVDLVDLSLRSDYSSSQQHNRNLALTECDRTLVHSGGGSGGYAEQVVRYISKTLLNMEVDIRFTSVRNKDFHEMKISNEGGEVLLSVATAYGFRNIQALVQKVKKGTCPYHFVEVMACPSGCLNGGGQIRSEAADTVENLKNVTQLYESAEIRLNIEDTLPDIPIIEEWLGSLTSPIAKQFLYTSYHEVPKAMSALRINW